SGALLTIRAASHSHLVLSHPHGERQQLRDLVSPSPATATGRSPGERLPTMPATLRLHDHNLVHLLHGQQRAVGSTVSWLSAALPAGGRGRRARRRLGWIRRRG